MNATKKSHFLNCPLSLEDARPKDLCLLMRQAPARSKVSLSLQGVSPLATEMNCHVSALVISFLHKEQTLQPNMPHTLDPGIQRETSRKGRATLIRSPSSLMQKQVLNEHLQ